MLFKIIRCNLRFDLVAVVTPPDATLETPGAQYYIFDVDNDRWFHSASKDEILALLGSQGDGAGQEKFPDTPFEGLLAVMEWIGSSMLERPDLIVLGRSLLAEVRAASVWRDDDDAELRLT